METALSYALTYISSLTKSTIKSSTISIIADDDYYSQPSNRPNTSERFSDFGVRLQDAHKTGLGSSAALVTAFTGAVLSHYLPKSKFDITSKEGRTRLHNLAQAAHCAAQGKVGSGFDVAAAVYGTCVYRRFSPSILNALGEVGSVDFSKRVLDVVEEKDGGAWDTEVVKGTAQIPQGMTLLMCDVDCGSQTVGMVKKVLEWRKQDASGSKSLWDNLQTENDNLAAKLASRHEQEMSKAFGNIRALIRDMGVKSGVPIEPTEQTELLDALSRLEGVVGGVVPGAGGYDAVALLVKDDEGTIAEVKTFLADWSKQKSSNVKLLNVKGEMEGVRVEGDVYGSWAI